VSSSIPGWRLVLIGFFAAAMLVPVTMPVAVLRSLVHDRFGVSELATSLFMSINMIGAAVGAPLVGILSDRLPGRRGLIAAALLADAACFGLLTLPASFTVFLGIRFAEGIAHSVALSGLLALLSDSPGRPGRLMGTAGAGITFGVAVGAPLGGFIGTTDPLAPLAAGAILLVAMAGVSILLLPEAPRSGPRPSAREIVRLVTADTALIAPYAYVFTDRFTTGFFTTTFSLYLRRVFDLPPPRIGLLIACFMVPFSVLSYPAGRLADRYSRTRLVAAGSLVYGIGTASLGWWTPDALPYLMLGLGTMAAVMFVPAMVMTRDLAAPAARVTALGGFNAAGALGFIAGPLVGGWVSQTAAALWSWEAGYRAAFVVAGLSEVVCVALTIPLLRRLRREGRTT
jgi:MFS family permease